MSTTIAAGFCVEAFNEAIAWFKMAETFNTDRGAQFAGEEFPFENQIRFSTEDKGRRRDDVFLERLWRSVKYDEPSLEAYDTEREARSFLAKCSEFYHHERDH